MHHLAEALVNVPVLKRWYGTMFGPWPTLGLQRLPFLPADHRLQYLYANFRIHDNDNERDCARGIFAVSFSDNEPQVEMVGILENRVLTTLRIMPTIFFGKLFSR
jgi:hypothetical protein